MGGGGGGGGALFVAVLELLHSRISEVARGFGGYMYMYLLGYFFRQLQRASI